MTSIAENRIMSTFFLGTAPQLAEIVRQYKNAMENQTWEYNQLDRSSRAGKNLSYREFAHTYQTLHQGANNQEINDAYKRMVEAIRSGAFTIQMNGKKYTWDQVRALLDQEGVAVSDAELDNLFESTMFQEGLEVRAHYSLKDLKELGKEGSGRNEKENQ